MRWCRGVVGTNILGDQAAVYPFCSVQTSPEINEVPINLWSLYNLVTQLGGWATVASNHWVGHLMKCKPEWAPLAWQVNTASRVKGIYSKYLLPFEKVCDTGAR